MSCLLQIKSVLLFTILVVSINGSPFFQGFSVHKGFEVNLKPFDFKPLTFIKEKWSPFGRWGVRRGIQKRDLKDSLGVLDDRAPQQFFMAPAPVYENVAEPKPIQPGTNVISPTMLRPGPNPEAPGSGGFFTTIEQKPANNFIVQRSAEPIVVEMYGELPPRPVGPIPPQPEVTIPEQQENSPRPIELNRIQPVRFFSAQPVSSPRPIGLNPIQPISSPEPVQPITMQPIHYKYITFRPVKPPQPGPVPAQPIGFIPMQPLSPVPVQPVTPAPVPPASPAPISPGVSLEIVPLIKPPPSAVPNTPISEIPPTEGPLMKGSRIALYFGNVLLQLVSQFLTNARMQFSQTKIQPMPLPPLPVSN